MLRISHLFVQSFWNLKRKFQHRVEDAIFCPLTTESQPLLSYSEKTIKMLLRRYWLYGGLRGGISLCKQKRSKIKFPEVKNETVGERSADLIYEG